MSNPAKFDKCFGIGKKFKAPRLLEVKIRPSEHYGKFCLVLCLGFFLTIYGSYVLLVIDNTNPCSERNVFPFYTSDTAQARTLLQVELMMQTFLGILLLVAIAFKFAVFFMFWTLLTFCFMIMTFAWHCIPGNPTWLLALAWTLIHLVEMKIVSIYVDRNLQKQLEILKEEIKVAESKKAAQETELI